MTPSIAQDTALLRYGVAPRSSRSHRITIVSNRLSSTVRVEGGAVRLSPSSGGLASGLRRVHARSSATWIGWPGIAAETARAAQREIDARLLEAGARGIPLSDGEVGGFYRRVANGVLWPVLHDTVPDTPAAPADWNIYRAVNARFADVILREARPGDRIWVHDYHLMLLPRMLRERRSDLRVAFFLHTPFPGEAPLAALPQAGALIDGILGADVVAFHTQEYVERFSSAVRALLGRRVELTSGSGVADDAGRPVCVHACPMSVDVAGFAARAADRRVAPRVAALRAAGRPLFVGVDRLDPTKGIPRRLEAFGRLLDARPDLRGRARLLQLSVPSREDMPAYRALRTRVDAIAADLNARLGTRSWQPVEHRYGSVDEIELAALYRAADVMLVTPFCDGMNLVAKEFVASRTDHDGVLVLSERAGAAAELSAALLVDPRDLDGLACAYGSALDMSPAERRVRMRRLAARVHGHDVRRWAEECLHQLDAAVRMARDSAS
ncbi:MAG: alpha,alpha-trehalose-phosphate synthase (UDP-forming) [Gemmatimonadales bacterium]